MESTLTTQQTVIKKEWKQPVIEIISKDEITHQLFPGHDGGGGTSSAS